VRRKRRAKTGADEQEAEEEAYGAGPREPTIAKPISIKSTGGKSGGRAWKAVERIAGDLPCAAESWTEDIAR
jgi:hypothetical protein